jgi:hypothetical protein
MMRTPIAVILLVATLHPAATAQRSFSDSSHLRDAAYVREHIKEISSAELWSSLDPGVAGLERARTLAAAGKYSDAAAAWGEYWKARKQPTYVTQTDHQYLDTDLLTGHEAFRIAIERAPDEGDTILTRAGLMMHNVIRTWGDSVIRFGDRVDFNRDIGHSLKYGFHYWMWSRPLIMAAVLTGDQKYVAKFDELFNQWYDQRNAITNTIPNLDVVYYELGLGVRNRMFIENYFLPNRERTPDTHERLLKTVLGAGRWLYELQRWEGYRPGNWQIHGSYMLVQLGLVFPEFRESAEWLRMGLQRMMEHLDQDFFPDGGHSERAPRNYTLATYLNYRNLAYLLEAYGAHKEISEKIRASMGRTIDWWLTMITPTGEVPAINDSHRGLVPEMILRDGAEFFRKPQVYAVLRTLLGGKGGGTDSLPPYTSRHMPASGFTVMRSDWTPEALYCSINYGPFAGFHSHFDLLDFELYAYGKPLAVDAGIGLTYDDPLYETWYRSSRAHNMVAVNDSNIERDGVQGTQILWGSTRSLDFFSGVHDGYERFGVRHRRQVAFVKPSYWLMLDDITCTRFGDTLMWYFHSPETLQTSQHGFVSIHAPGIRISQAGSEFSTERGSGMAASTSNRTPGKTQEIGWIRFNQESNPDSLCQFALLLEPFRENGPARTAERISKRHFVVKSGSEEDHLYFTLGPYTDGTLETDASVVLLRMKEGAHASFVVHNARYLRYGDKILWNSVEPSSGEGEIP